MIYMRAGLPLSFSGCPVPIPKKSQPSLLPLPFPLPNNAVPYPQGPFVKMSQTTCLTLAILLIAAVRKVPAQSAYTVIPVINGGTITGTVKWSGPEPRGLDVPVNKDPEICDPESHKRINLERMVIGPDGGVANTIIYLKNISHGKEMNLPVPRRSLDQKHCRYEPHILLVPQNAELAMKSSDAVLHTVRMDGAASFNLPFQFTDRVTTRNMNTPGLVNLRCNGGHVWMNAEMMVVPHPYYSVSDQNGRFELTDVPPGNYEVVAWHEGWQVLGRENAVDVFSQKTIQRAIFNEPKTWEQNVTVHAGETVPVNFVISQK
jgi:polysaccharide lyase family 4-like protein